MNEITEKLNPETLCDLLFKNADTFNKGFSVTDLIVNGWFEDENTLPEEALNAVMQTEGRLFTFFGSLKKSNLLKTKLGHDRFLYSSLELETEIINFFRKYGSGTNYLELIESEEFKPFNASVSYGAGERYVKFTIDIWSDNYSVKVYHDTGYREGFINDEYLFTKAGGLELTDLYTLFSVHEAKPANEDVGEKAMEKLLEDIDKLGVLNEDGTVNLLKLIGNSIRKYHDLTVSTF